MNWKLNVTEIIFLLIDCYHILVRNKLQFSIYTIKNRPWYDTT